MGNTNAEKPRFLLGSSQVHQCKNVITCADVHVPISGVHMNMSSPVFSLECIPDKYNRLG